MANAIILHGLPEKDRYLDPSSPSPSNSHWLPWLQKQLMVKGIKADTPEVPDSYKADYVAFVKEVERFEINQDTILVGHSMGAGFWVRYLCDNPHLKVHKVILVAPWLNTKNEVNTDFFDFKLRSDFTDQAGSITIFSSNNDFKEVQDSVEYLKAQIPGIKIVEFKRYGHFTKGDLGSDEFPELLSEALS